MPGRVATSRSARSSATPRTSTLETAIPDEGAETSLRRSVCSIFADCQKSTTGHRKLVISLRKLQEACCYEPVTKSKGKKQQEEFEEENFTTEVVRCVLRVLMVKKSEPVGDRVVRFLGTFLKVASDKDIEVLSAADPDLSALPETPTARLTTQILSTLLPLLMVKDKTVRFRATQVTSHIINSLDTLDDGLFHLLRLALLKRIHDKEAPVRLQAVYGLGRLAAEVEDDGRDEDSDSEDDNGRGVLVKLLDILQNDPSAEVRRNLLLNLPLTKEVLPYLLERARDADGATRRALYARLLPALGDFRHLSLTHREKLLRWGLRDRDENVRKATARLFCERWIEDCAALPAAQAAEEEEGEQKPANQAADPSLDALLELLERIDVVNSGVEGGIAQVAMKEFWDGRPDYLQYVSFPDGFWEDLSPELAFVARTFNDFCRSSGKEDGYTGPRALDAMVEEKLPEVTRFGFLLERELNRLVETVRLAASGEDEEAEEDSVQREFVVEQMLHMALSFDYSDEVGRRKMFGLMREALALAELPEEATRLVVEVLRLVCGVDAKGEREFCGVVLEAVAEVHDTIMGEDSEADGSSSVDDSFHSANSQPDGESTPTKKTAKKAKKAGEGNVEENEEMDEDKAIREIMVNMKCLHIAQCMLQNVQCVLEDNVHLVTMLNNLVVPAVRSQEAPIRERGLLCLGLCCLLGKNLAEENLTLFLHCFAKGHPALQTIALQIITDILITHPTLLAPPSSNSNDETETEEAAQNPLLKPVLKALTRALKSSADTNLQSTAATSISKLLLSAILPPASQPQLLQTLLITYFDPSTAPNQALRQSLAYFLPVFAHSRASNAQLMVDIAVPVLAKLATLREAALDELEADENEDEAGLVKLTAVGAMLLDWTDPRRVVGFAEATTVGKVDGSEAGELHFQLCEHILERLVTSQVSKEERKVLFSVLAKLYLPTGGCGVERLKTLLELLAEAQEGRVASDATSKNTLAKLQGSFLKMIGEAMTAERGGGGAEETVLEDDEDEVVETTEIPVRTSRKVMTAQGDELEVSEVTAAGAEEGEEDEGIDESVTQLQREMQDTTIGATTFGKGIDAEGTKLGIGAEEDESLVDHLIESSVLDEDGDTEMG